MAGAAEEILGKMIKEIGKHPPMYDSIIGLLNDVSVKSGGSEYDKKTFNNVANSARNQLKHHQESGYVKMDFKQEAVNIIHRLVFNYQAVEGYTPEYATKWIKELDLDPKWPINYT